MYYDVVRLLGAEKNETNIDHTGTPFSKSSDTRVFYSKQNLLTRWGLRVTQMPIPLVEIHCFCKQREVLRTLDRKLWSMLGDPRGVLEGVSVPWDLFCYVLLDVLVPNLFLSGLGIALSIVRWVIFPYLELATDEMG